MLSGWIPSEKQAKMFSIVFQKGEERVLHGATRFPWLGGGGIRENWINYKGYNKMEKIKKEVKGLWNLIFSKMTLQVFKWYLRYNFGESV